MRAGGKGLRDASFTRLSYTSQPSVSVSDYLSDAPNSADSYSLFMCVLNVMDASSLTQSALTLRLWARSALAFGARGANTRDALCV